MKDLKKDKIDQRPTILIVQALYLEDKTMPSGQLLFNSRVRKLREVMVELEPRITIFVGLGSREFACYFDEFAPYDIWEGSDIKVGISHHLKELYPDISSLCDILVVAEESLKSTLDIHYCASVTGRLTRMEVKAYDELP